MKVVLTNDGSRTLYCEASGEAFHSTAGAASEARHVFLINSGVQSRLEQGRPTRLLEIGFGTGLNFLLTADAALKQGTRLDYTGVDLWKIDPNQTNELGYRQLLDHGELIDQLASCLTQSDPSGCRFEMFAGRPPRLTVELQVYWRDAQTIPSGTFDCIYFDPFSPSANAKLWTESYLASLHDRLTSGGTLATYCCKSEIQRRLTAVGFDVDKRPGPPGGKREMLIALKRRTSADDVG